MLILDETNIIPILVQTDITHLAGRAYPKGCIGVPDPAFYWRPFTYPAACVGAIHLS